MLTESVAKTRLAVVTAGESATPSSECVSNITRTRSTSSKAAHSERRSQPCWAPTIWRSPDHRSDSISTLSGRWAIIGINYFPLLSQSIYRPKTIAVSLVADLEGTPPSFYWSSPLSRDLDRIKRWWRWWLSMIKWSGWDKRWSVRLWEWRRQLRVYSCHILSQSTDWPQTIKWRLWQRGVCQ